MNNLTERKTDAPGLKAAIRNEVPKWPISRYHLSTNGTDVTSEYDCLHGRAVRGQVERLNSTNPIGKEKS